MARGTRSTKRSAVAEPRSLILPAWGWYLAFFFVPIGFLVVYAFGRNSSTEFFVVQFGLFGDQFERLWDSLYFDVFKDTFIMAFTGTIGCFLIGFPLAYYLATRPKKHKTLLLLLVIVPFWTSLLIRTYAWVIILNEQGPLSEGLQDLNLIANPLNILYTPTAVWIGVVYDYLPLMVFPLYVALEKIDRRLIEASRDLGATRWSTFRSITWPLALPGVVTGALLTFIPMTGEYVVPQILGGAKSFLVGSLVANEILTAVNWPFGAAIALTLTAILLVVIGLYMKTMGNRTEETLGAAL
jgi:spermidine/putrescine transport system permease protein